MSCEVGLPSASIGIKARSSNGRRHQDIGVLPRNVLDSVKSRATSTTTTEKVHRWDQKFDQKPYYATNKITYQIELEFPKFNDKNLNNWVLRVKYFFQVDETTPEN